MRAGKDSGGGLLDWGALGPRILYLMLCLPLGIAYFTFTVVFFSVGLATLIIGIGIPILLFLFLGSFSLLSLERRLTRSLLQLDVPRRSPLAEPTGVLRRLTFYAGRLESWSGLLYLILKLPLGILSFVLTLVSVILPLSLAMAAFVSLFLTALPIELGWGRTVYLDPLSGAALLGLLAALLGLGGLAIILALSKFWEALNGVMLSPETSLTQVSPPDSRAVVIQ